MMGSSFSYDTSISIKMDLFEGNKKSREKISQAERELF